MACGNDRSDEGIAPYGENGKRPVECRAANDRPYGWVHNCHLSPITCRNVRGVEGAAPYTP